jgi:hypothetical protein
MSTVIFRARFREGITNVKDLVLHIGEGLLVDVTMQVDSTKLLAKRKAKRLEFRADFFNLFNHPNLRTALLSCGSVAASVLGKSKSIPFATSGFAEHVAPV